MQIDELAAQERWEYMQKWRAANREKVKKHNADYWRRRAERKMQEGANHEHTTNENN